MRIASAASLARQQAFEGYAAGWCEIQADDDSPWREFGKNSLKGLLQQQYLGAGISEDEELFGDRQPPIQWHQHCAEPRTRVEQDQVVRPIQAQDRDAVTASDTKLLLQGCCSAFDAIGERGVAQPFPLEGNGRLVWRKRRIAIDQTAEIHRQSSVSPASYSASRPMRSRQSSAVQGSISEPHRLSR